MHRTGSKSLGAILVVVLLLAAVPVLASEEVRFPTSDGAEIAATFFRPQGKARVPAVVLLHQLGSDRHAWKALAQKLTLNNYAVLAIDLRGHGESTQFDDRVREFLSQGFP